MSWFDRYTNCCATFKLSIRIAVQTIAVLTRLPHNSHKSLIRSTCLCRCTNTVYVPICSNFQSSTIMSTQDQNITNITGGHHVQVLHGDYNRITMGLDPAARKQEGELLPLMISTCILLRYWHQALKKLFDHIASSALHNSSESYDRGKCHPGTRKFVLEKILQWAKNPNNLGLLMWIFGPAGAGKSSIMQSIAEPQ